MTGSVEELSKHFSDLLRDGNARDKSVNPLPKTPKGLINNINRAYKALGFPCRHISLAYD